MNLAKLFDHPASATRLPDRKITVITGFNTDIEFGGVTYHVQTEDKGVAKPVIMSLVYDRGTILASKRLPYDDLIAGGLDEKVLAERLQKQHRAICAALRAGRLEDLKKMSRGDPAAQRSVKVPKPSIELAFAGGETTPSIHKEMPIPRPDLGNSIKVKVDDLLVDAVTILDDSFLLPDEAVEIISDGPMPFRPANNKLSLEILGDVALKGGDRRSVGFMVCRGSERKVVGDAQIMVKILGSSFRPQIYHAKTDSNGLARINVQLPNFNAGRAAFLVRAMSSGEEIELRRPIAHG
ncbi:MAG: hypothetical protein ACR2IH_11420 [Pyrinomonadaceae bacterium]